MGSWEPLGSFRSSAESFIPPSQATKVWKCFFLFPIPLPLAHPFLHLIIYLLFHSGLLGADKRGACSHDTCRTTPFKLQSGSAALSPEELLPHQEGRQSKAWKSQAALQHPGMLGSLAGDSKPVPAVGHSVGLLQWYLECPVIPPVCSWEYPGCIRG